MANRLLAVLCATLILIAGVGITFGAGKDDRANMTLSVVDLDRFAVPGIATSLAVDENLKVETQADEFGRARYAGLKPGRYYVQATSSDGEVVHRFCTLKAGENKVELSYEKEILKIDATDSRGDPTACRVWRYFPADPSIRDEAIVNETGKTKIIRRNCEYPCLIVADGKGVTQSQWIEKRRDDLVLKFNKTDRHSFGVKIGEDYRKKVNGNIQVWLTGFGTILADGIREIPATQMDPKTGVKPEVQYIASAKEGLHEVVVIIEKTDKTYEAQWLDSFFVNKDGNSILSISANSVQFEGTLESVRQRISFVRAINRATIQGPR